MSPHPDARALRDAIVRGELSASEAVEQSLEQAQGEGARLHAFLVVDAEGARARARELDARRAAGEDPGVLFGVPVALKSNLCLEGVESNCGSRILEGWTAPYTATCVQRLLDAGAVPVGMTNMDEFAMGSSTENSAYGAARNPWDPTRTPGGSSGGSAVAVAAGIVPLALGSDTGGSVRQPAALCGIAGFKPTYGRVSRFGLVAFGSSLDQVSPLARSVGDLELALSVIGGHDPADSTCLEENAPQPELAQLEGLRIGVPDALLSEGLDPGVRARVEEAIAHFEAQGAQRVAVELPHAEHSISTYYVVATAEASSNLARFDGVRFGLRAQGDGSLDGMYAATRGAGFGAEVERRILLGTYVLSAGYVDAWYRRAMKVRRLIAGDFERAFESVDLLLTPTTPEPAFALGDKADDPVAMYLSDVMTVTANLAGLPAVSVPCGFTREGGVELPVGLQLIGPARADARVLGIARCFEETTEHRRQPAPRVAEGGAA